MARALQIARHHGSGDGGEPASRKGTSLAFTVLAVVTTGRRPRVPLQPAQR